MGASSSTSADGSGAGEGKEGGAAAPSVAAEWASALVEFRDATTTGDLHDALRRLSRCYYPGVAATEDILAELASKREKHGDAWSGDLALHSDALLDFFDAPAVDKADGLKTLRDETERYARLEGSHHTGFKGFHAIMHVLHALPDFLVLQKEGMEFLAHAMTMEGMPEQILDTGGVPVALAALKTHMSDGALARNAVAIVHAACDTPGGLVTCQNLGCAEVLEAAIDAHPDERGCLILGHAALKLLKKKK